MMSNPAPTPKTARRLGKSGRRSAATVPTTPLANTNVPLTFRASETPVTSADVSPNAAIGGIRPDRRAGTAAAITVVMVPSARPHAIVQTEIAGIAASMVKILAMAFLASQAPPTPVAKPITDPTTPIMAASATTLQTICRELAPATRSSASSRVRCATRIENVFAIVNPATISPITPNAWQNLVINTNDCDA